MPKASVQATAKRVIDLFEAERDDEASAALADIKDTKTFTAVLKLVTKNIYGSNVAEYFKTRSKIPRGRGMAQASLDLIEAMRAAIEAAQPITGRGVGYKLFTLGLIPSMARQEMAKVYRL